jgi:hypothetical protein
MNKQYLDKIDGVLSSKFDSLGVEDYKELFGICLIDSPCDPHGEPSHVFDPETGGIMSVNELNGSDYVIISSKQLLRVLKQTKRKLKNIIGLEYLNLEEVIKKSPAKLKDTADEICQHLKKVHLNGYSSLEAFVRKTDTDDPGLFEAIKKRSKTEKLRWDI